MQWTEMVTSIREEYVRETGDDPGRKGAALILERMVDAFRERFDGAGAAYAVRQSPDLARYLVDSPYGWKGADRMTLKAALAENNVVELVIVEEDDDE